MRASHGDGVGIHAQRLHAGEQRVEIRLDALRPVAEKAQLAAADRALRIDPPAVAAVVADEHLVALMIRQADAAVRAGIGRAALGTGDDLTRATPVEKQNALLAASEILLQLAIEHGADGAGVAVAQFLLHIGDDDVRQLTGIEPIRQREVMIAPGLGVIAADNVRRCRAEQQQRTVLGAAELGHVARVIARRALGLIGVLLLLVDDEQAEILHGCENRAARADNDARETRADALPLVVALRERQAAVQNGDRVTEIGGKRLDHLRRQ